MKFNEIFKKGFCVAALSILTVSMCIQSVNADMDLPAGINPHLGFGDIVPLTVGSSTTLNLKTDGDFKFDLNHLINVNLTIVLCLGEGTLTVDLKKQDTKEDLVSMFILGYPATPLFVPNFGITPATISSSTVIDATLGGFGIVFISSGVNSGKEPPYAYTLSLALKK